jgi:hypothetical protein
MKQRVNNTKSNVSATRENDLAELERQSQVILEADYENAQSRQDSVSGHNMTQQVSLFQDHLHFDGIEVHNLEPSDHFADFS